MDAWSIIVTRFCSFQSLRGLKMALLIMEDCFFFNKAGCWKLIFWMNQFVVVSQHIKIRSEYPLLAAFSSSFDMATTRDHGGTIDSGWNKCGAVLLGKAGDNCSCDCGSRLALFIWKICLEFHLIFQAALWSVREASRGGKLQTQELKCEDTNADFVTEIGNKWNKNYNLIF